MKKFFILFLIFLSLGLFFSFLKLSHQEKPVLAQTEGQIDLSASVTTAAKWVYKKYAFPVQTSSQFNFIGLSGSVSISSNTDTFYQALISIQNVPSGNCPAPGTVWDTYGQMAQAHPGVHSISNFNIKNVGQGRKEMPTNFTLPIKAPIEGCIFVLLDGGESMRGDPITMESQMSLIYDTGPPISPAPYFIQLDHEFCYGQQGCFLWTPEAKPENAFAKTIKLDSPLYLWSLSGDVATATFTSPWAGHPTGQWTTNFDYYLYENCPPPPIGNSGPADYYSQIPGDATNLLSFQFQGDGKGVFNQVAFKKFGPKLIEPGNCLVTLTNSVANGALTNESQIFALVQPVPSDCQDDDGTCPEGCIPEVDNDCYPHPPEIISIEPSSGSSKEGENVVLAAVYSDPNGADDIEEAYIWIDTTAPHSSRIPSSVHGKMKKEDDIYKYYGNRYDGGNQDCGGGCTGKCCYKNYIWDVGGYEVGSGSWIYQNSDDQNRDTVSETVSTISKVRAKSISVEADNLVVEWETAFEDFFLWKDLNSYLAVIDFEGNVPEEGWWPKKGEWRVLRGDLNNDGLIDSQDLKILLQNWGSSSSIPEADLNSDGVVNGIDFGIMVKLIL